MYIYYDISTPLLYILSACLNRDGYVEWNDTLPIIEAEIYAYGYSRIEWLLTASDEELRQLGRFYQILWYGA